MSLKYFATLTFENLAKIREICESFCSRKFLPLKCIFNFESPKIIVVGASVLVFLFNIIFPCPCWVQDCYYRFDHFCEPWLFFFDIFLQNFKTVHCRKIFIGVCFYHIWRFLRVLKLVFVIVISVTSVVFSSITGWFWLPVLFLW